VDLQTIRDRALEHQADLEARLLPPARLPASEFFTADQAAEFLGVSADEIRRFVPATCFPSPRNPRWSKEDLISLEAGEGECQVYAMRRPDTHEIKIGISTNPFQRLRDIQRCHARRLELLVVFPGTVVDEVALHERFKAHRLRGEWFDEALEIRVWIADQRLCSERRARSEQKSSPFTDFVPQSDLKNGAALNPPTSDAPAL
jgi:hypothetical protein